MMRAAALTLLLASACIPSEGPMMTPFQDCLGCHASGGGAKTWTVAGTWAKGASVTVTDANGKTVPLKGNDAGNFYTAEGLTFPLTASVNGKPMPVAVTYGGCNACHRAELVTTGPEMAPGSACLTCHGPNGIASKKFTAAGTFPPQGQQVRVGGQSTTTNAVGNFYIEAPITFTAATSVGGRSMEGGAPHGDCNQCHGAGGVGGD